MHCLDAILLEKQQEVLRLKEQVARGPNRMLAKYVSGVCQKPSRDCFKAALQQKGLSVIAEIKRRSPSKGHLADILDPGALACAYVGGGAQALSVLTDASFFGGHLEDLKMVRSFVDVPILRKDFIVDEIQIAEAVEAGADAVLLIVSVLKERTVHFLKYAKNLGIEALVEVHDQSELSIAIASGAQIIGINHRNLSNFEVDVALGFRMIQEIPDAIVTVAESGLSAPFEAKRCQKAGYDAVLIGEALVKSEDPEAFIRACQS